MFKTLAFQPENGFCCVSADTMTWAAARFLRDSAKFLPFLGLYVLYQTTIKCSMKM